MARPRHTPGQPQTRDRILDAAEELFGRDGFAGCRVSHVAEKVGVGRPTIVHHFGSKSDLHEAVIGRVFRDIAQVADEAIDLSATGPDQVTGLWSALVAFGRERPWAARVALFELVTPREGRSEAAIARFNRLVDSVAALMGVHAEAAGLPEGYPVRTAVLGLVTSFMVHMAAGGRLGADSLDWTELARATFLPRGGVEGGDE